MSSLVNDCWWAQRLRTSDTSNTSDRTEGPSACPNASFQVALMPLNKKAESPVEGGWSGLWSLELTCWSQPSP